MADTAQIGIVAIGRNEGERLIRCLASMPLGMPVVYVDSASTDGSQAAAESAGAIVLALDMARPFTAARARAEGVAMLFDRFPDTDFVMFIDGDCEMEPGWLDAGADFLSTHPDFAAVCGRRRERHPEASFYNALADLEWDTPVGEAEACGGDSMMRADAYRQAGGFDPRIIAGEEPELCSRLRKANWRVMRLDAPMTIHDAATFHFSQWWNRGVRSGFGYAQTWRATRSGGSGLYARELARAVVWAGVLPLVSIVAAVVVHPAAILLWPVLSLLQLIRLGAKWGMRRAVLTVTMRYAELLGALRYGGRLASGSPGGTITYK
ncbi:glycosyltransferase [Sphingomonas panacisoli]|uniref:Glycosyltransferase n=1 Tax=Sphingomonas panacisoli TaxID=1813879 RepID=A0A5B8LKI0_9SPHN|nr:glycosyltransferase family 2 protein [Sphingomonas panacisoli]QDZ08052.1 glycosyltransferase [Sphingomonas panacisoli]